MIFRLDEYFEPPELLLRQREDHNFLASDFQEICIPHPLDVLQSLFTPVQLADAQREFRTLSLMNRAASDRLRVFSGDGYVRKRQVATLLHANAVKVRRDQFESFLQRVEGSGQLIPKSEWDEPFFIHNFVSGRCETQSVEDDLYLWNIMRESKSMQGGSE